MKLLKCVNESSNDIALPLQDTGTIVIHNAEFIRKENVVGSGYSYAIYRPQLAFTIINHTSAAWNSITLRFDMGGYCKDLPRQWSRIVVMSLGWTEDHHIAKGYSDIIIPLIGNVDDCHTELIKVRL